MKLFLKVLILQAFWFLVLKVDRNFQVFVFIASLFLVILNYIFFRPKISLKNYIKFVLFVSSFGVFHEGLFNLVNLIQFPNHSGPWFLVSLYVVFVCYYGDVFNKFEDWSFWKLTFLGGGAGLLSYTSGVKIAGAQVTSDVYYLGVFFLWGVFFPLSLNVFRKISCD
jgi:hypothetical protein